MNLPPSLTQLIDELAKLPGVGKKSAKRLAFSLIEKPYSHSKELADSILRAKTDIKHCKNCFAFTESELCTICSSSRRNQEIICVVEDPKNVFTIESSGVFDGVYHVLQGAISPIQGISPEHLKIAELMKRVSGGKVSELIIATNPTLEGEATAHFLLDQLKDYDLIISRIARGMPAGGDLEFTDSTTLSRAFEGRTKF
jgi:recombination protein RecR